MSGLLVNPIFVARFYKDFGGADGTLTAVDSNIIGISVACLQLTAALGALIAGRLGDIIGRKNVFASAVPFTSSPPSYKSSLRDLDASLLAVPSKA